LEPTHNGSGSVTACDVLAFGSVRAAAAELAGLRTRPGPAPAQPLPSGFLKHADDQTVVAIAAVFQAVAAGGLASLRFTEWGVLAAPRFFGRVTLAQALQRFAAEGAWGVTPHLIPHRSLHSISGTISQALRIHGPNFGVGGGPGGPLEVLRAAWAMLHGDKLPGVWVVMTGWDPEPIPDGSGLLPGDAQCVGLALALTMGRPGWRGARLHLVPAEQTCGAAGSLVSLSTPDLLNLESLFTALTAADVRSAAVVWQLPDGGRLELERAEPSKGLAGPHAWLANGRVGVGSSGTGAENPL